jgi:hypothetical protein
MKLPEIFKNKIDENLDNNTRTFRGNATETPKEDILDNLPVKVIINQTNGKEIKTTVVGRTKNYIITKNRDVISINDIKEIKKD